MQKTKLKGRVIVEGKCEGKALVSSDPLSFLGGVDPTNGIIIEKDHDLQGRCIKDKILCFPHGHGSTVGSYVIYALTNNKLAPKALINKKADPVVVVGAIIGEIPMMDRVDITQIKCGDTLQVDAYKGNINVLNRTEK